MKWSAEITSLPSVSVILKVLFLLPHHCSLRPPCHPHKLAVRPSPGTLGCWSVPGASSTKVPQGLCRCAVQALPSLTAAWLCRACCVCSTIREMGDGTVYQIPGCTAVHTVTGPQAGALRSHPKACLLELLSRAGALLQHLGLKSSFTFPRRPAGVNWGGAVPA